MAFAANTSRSDSSPARCSSTAARNCGAFSLRANLIGCQARYRQEARQPRRLLRQERKPLSGNAFRRFQGQGLARPKHVSFVTLLSDSKLILNSWLRILKQSRAPGLRRIGARLTGGERRARGAHDVSRKQASDFGPPARGTADGQDRADRGGQRAQYEALPRSARRARLSHAADAQRHGRACSWPASSGPI